MGKKPVIGLAGLFLAGGLLSGCWWRDNNCCKDCGGTCAASGSQSGAGYRPGSTFAARNPATGTTASMLGQGGSSVQMPPGGGQGMAMQPTGNTAAGSNWGQSSSATLGGMGGSSMTSSGLGTPPGGQWPGSVPSGQASRMGDDMGNTSNWPGTAGPGAGTIRQTSGVMPGSPPQPSPPGTDMAPPSPPQGSMSIGTAPGAGTPAGGPSFSRYPPTGPGGSMAPVSPSSTPVVPPAPPATLRQNDY